jgi:hypothetical protein
MRDIVNKKCIFDNCSNSASYSDASGGPAIYCSIHANKETMINNKHPKCNYIINGEKCKKIASFSQVNGELTVRNKLKKTRCAAHKNAGRIY